MPSPFSFFAGGIRFIFETDDNPENVVLMFYMAMEPEDRIKFRAFIVDLLKPPIDLQELERIWDKSGGSISFAKPENLVAFLRRVLEICEDRQKLIDAHPDPG